MLFDSILFPNSAFRSPKLLGLEVDVKIKAPFCNL